MSARVRRSRLWACGAANLAAIALAGCAREERIVRYNPFLGGLPGSTTTMPAAPRFKEHTDPSAFPEDQIRVEDSPGKVRLSAKAGRHLMIHIVTTLDGGERELFTDQVLSQATRREFNARGRSPSEAFDMLLERRMDIQALFDQMPAGEFTPGVIARTIGPGRMRLEVYGLAARGLRWTVMDMVMEENNWKLLWFGRAGRGE